MKYELLIAGALLSAGASKAAERLNVVMILADDLGWADTTPYGHTRLYETPNIQRLAARGMTFTRAYSNSPLCSPTRASILTGQTPARHGSTSPVHHTPEARLKPIVEAKTPADTKARRVLSVSRLDMSLPTLGKLLKGSGYKTAHFGKWHLGPEPYSPLEHGFDVDIPHWPGPGPAGSFVAPWKFPTFKPNSPSEHIEDRMAFEAVQWLKSITPETPFYMNYWQFSVHAPFDAKQDLVEKYRKMIDPADEQRSPTYAAMVHSMDDAVGTLLDALDANGLADHTVIIFTSDNGGNCYDQIDNTRPTSNRPLRGGKATVYEGGIRVPCVIAWPGITKPGSRSDAVIQASDIYPTLQKNLGLNPPPSDYVVDGVDIMPALRGEALDRESIFTYFPYAPKVPDWLPASVAVHAGDWKLIRLFHEGENGAHGYRLYNLAEDLGEKNDLSRVNHEKVKDLDVMIEDYLKRSHAVVPLPNPAFDTAKYHPELIGVPVENHKLKPADSANKQSLKGDKHDGS